MFNYPLYHNSALPSHIRAQTTPTTTTSPTHLLNFSKPVTVNAHNSAAGSEPKSWFTKKFIPTFKKVGNIAGKVATVASIL
jgi:hypothetical protein